LSFAEQKEKTTETFKSEYKINNKVKDKDDEKEYQITKVDSFGNKYYKKDGKVKIADNDNQDVRNKGTRFVDKRRNASALERNGFEGEENTGYIYNKEEGKWKNVSVDDAGKRTTKNNVTDSEKVKQLNADAVQEIMKTTT
jgi:hypothetical protein